MTTREGSLGLKTHSYELAGGYKAIRMGNEEWAVEDHDGKVEHWFDTLREARSWAKAQPKTTE